MSPKSQGHCWICPLCCLFVPSYHTHHQKLRNKLLIFTNKGSHPVFYHQTVFELFLHKIHALKRTANNTVPSILTTLEGLSTNEVPPDHEVKLFDRLCNTTAHQYKHCLTGSLSFVTHPTRYKLSKLGTLTLLDPIYTGEEYPEEYNLHSHTDMDITGANLP